MSTTVTKRSEQHEVCVDLDVSDVPVIDDRKALRTKYPIRPHLVRLTYTRGSGEWTARARVYGSPVKAPTLLNGWADYSSRCRFHEWPDWLREVADQQHPARPGGWPGDDPEGSYL
jgi:hypothetical protein